MNHASRDWTGSALANGRYEVLARIGEGGMGAVYRARDRNLDADVVIKVPLPSMAADPEFARRFQDEIRSLVKLSHPHIVKVSDVGEWEGLPFAVMQFLPGGSLEDRALRAGGRPPVGELAGWLRGVALALDFVHSRGYVHRDVKPGNILFDAAGNPYLGDFGVVKVLTSSAAGRAASSATGTGMVIGTAEYMAPELIMGDPIDGRVDQYALAVTAYEMACGRRPFEHEVKTKVLVLHTSTPPAPPAEASPGVPVRLSDAILKGLAKAPSDRYPSCSDFAAAVASAAAEDSPLVRLRCGSCGKKLGVSPRDFARLREPGRRLSCPKCKAPIDLSAGGATVLEPTPSGRQAAPGGTVLISVPSASGEGPGVPGPAAGGTRSLAVGEARADAAKTPPPRHRTVVERPSGAGSGPTRAIAREEVLPGLRIETPTVATPAPATISTPPRATPTRIAAALAAGLMAVAVGLAAWRALTPGEVPARPSADSPPAVAFNTSLRPGPEPRPDPSPVAPSMDPDRPGASDDPGTSPPPGRNNPGPKPSPVPESTGEEDDGGFGTAPGGETNPDKADAPSEPDGAAEGGDGPDEFGPGGGEGEMPSGGNDAPGARKPGEEKGARPAKPPEPVLLDATNHRRDIPLATLRKDPRSFAGRFVSLEQVYSFGTPAVRRPDGSIRLPLAESWLTETADSMKIETQNPTELDVDPGLAERLERLELLRIVDEAPDGPPSWEGQPAIVTVRVPDRPDTVSPGRVVRLELFHGSKTEIRGKGSAKLFVLFETRTITAQGDSIGEGESRDWIKTRKLGHLNQQYQKRFKAMQGRVSQAKWNQFALDMDRLLNQQLHDAIRGNQMMEQKALERLKNPLGR